MTAIIAIQDLSFSYPDGKLALENIDLQITPVKGGACGRQWCR